jgi:hypothetical protein
LFASYILRTNMADLDAALRKFEATESNLEKLEKLWRQIESHIPSGPAFGYPPEYEKLCLAFRRILPALPAIDGFRVEDRLHGYDEVGQMRLDALEIGEIEAQVRSDLARGTGATLARIPVQTAGQTA